MEKTRWEKHHARPVSLMGVDDPDNMIILRNDIHKDLHKTLDISHKFIREAREKLNGVIIYEPKHIEIIGWLQRRFFENMHKLSKPVQETHKDRVRNLYNKKYKEFHSYIKPLKENEYGLTVPQHTIKQTHRFDELFDQVVDLEMKTSYAKVQIIRLNAINAYTKWLLQPKKHESNTNDTEWVTTEWLWWNDEST